MRSKVMKTTSHRLNSSFSSIVHRPTWAMIATEVDDGTSKGGREPARASESSDRHRRSFRRLRRTSLTPRASSGVELPEIKAEDLQVVGVLAEDTCGRVLHAYDRQRHEDVAVKQLFGPLSPIAEDRFRRGALLPARLRHRGVVEIYGVGRWPQGDPFFVMQLVRGFELTALLGQARSLRERLPLLRHISACAEAIACAHAERIIHRDIKPENVLISNRGQAVMIDWGIAKDLGRVEPTGDSDLLNASSTDARKTGAGQVMGTPAYMAPEQARGERVDERADVYALGALLLHALTGVAPYPGDDADAIVERVVKGPPPALSMLSSSLRPGLVAVVEQALAREPEGRFRDGAALASALHELGL